VGSNYCTTSSARCWSSANQLVGEGDGEEVDAKTKALSRVAEAPTAVAIGYAAMVMLSSTQIDSTWSTEVCSAKVLASSATTVLMVFSKS
jgi:hypothetical protein